MKPYSNEQNKTKQNKTKQNKTKQNKTKQNKKMVFIISNISNDIYTATVINYSYLIYNNSIS